MIAFRTSSEDISPYERPAPREVARLREETERTVENLDQPADLLAEALDEQLKAYEGPMPTDHAGLRAFVIRQFRFCATVTAVSAMLEHFIESDEQSHIAAALRRMLVVIRSQSRPALACDCIATAFGMHISEGRSMEQMARAHGVTKQAFSKRTIRLCRELGVEPSVLMRSENSRQSYRLKQLQRHAAAREAGTGQGNMAALREKLARARAHVTGHELRLAGAAGIV